MKLTLETFPSWEERKKKTAQEDLQKGRLQEDRRPARLIGDVGPAVKKVLAVCKSGARCTWKPRCRWDLISIRKCFYTLCLNKSCFNMSCLNNSLTGLFIRKGATWTMITSLCPTRRPRKGRGAKIARNLKERNVWSKIVKALRSRQVAQKLVETRGRRRRWEGAPSSVAVGRVAPGNLSAFSCTRWVNCTFLLLTTGNTSPAGGRKRSRARVPELHC